MNSAKLPNGLLGELRDTLIDNFGAEDTKGVMRIIKAILLKYWPKNAQQPKDVARGVDTADCSTGAVSASFASGGSEGATTAALRPVYDEDIHQCATCGGMIAPGNACLFSVKAYCSDKCSRTQQALHPALPQLYERYDLAMKRVRESGLDKRPYWSGEATGLEIAINLLGGTTDDR